MLIWKSFRSSLINSLTFSWVLPSVNSLTKPFMPSPDSLKEPLILRIWSTPAVDSPISWPILLIYSIRSQLKLSSKSTCCGTDTSLQKSWSVKVSKSWTKRLSLEGLKFHFTEQFAYNIMLFDIKLKFSTQLLSSFIYFNQFNSSHLSDSFLFALPCNYFYFICFHDYWPHPCLRDPACAIKNLEFQAHD